MLGLEGVYYGIIGGYKIERKGKREVGKGRKKERERGEERREGKNKGGKKERREGENRK